MRRDVERAALAGANFDAENPPDSWEDCPQCECCHPDGYTGDCRDDAMRWPSTITTEGWRLLKID
jgi:hypothetical protein